MTRPTVATVPKGSSVPTVGKAPAPSGRSLRTAMRVFTVALLAFLLLRAPAALLGHLQVLPDGIIVAEWRGTLWRGGAVVEASGFERSTMAWSLRSIDPLRAVVGADWTAGGAHHQLGGHLQLGRHPALQHVGGSIGAAALAPLLQRYAIVPAGTLRIADLQLALEGDDRAQGELHWDGGLVHWQMGGASHEARFGAMRGAIGSGPQLDVTDATTGAPLLRITPVGDGWIDVAITRQLATLSGTPWAGQGPADQWVLTVRERVRD